METLFRCPKCDKVSLGVQQSQLMQQNIRCPHCERNGDVSFMEKQESQENTTNMGGGLHVRDK